ncbi:MAG: STAS domain-containing protein [Saprospiraceae bacterium]
MKYSIDKQENYTILELQEDNLNSLMAPSLKSEFVILKNEGIKNLILNLTPVKYVDSSGLSAILTANRLWSADGMFVLTGIVHDSVKKLIEISRLDSVIHVIPNVEQSVSALLEAQAEENAGAADSDNA